MENRLRVLWLIKGLGPGGAERLLVSAARVGDHKRFRYEVAYVLPQKATLVPELAAHGVHAHCLSDPHGSMPWPVTLRRLLTAEAYDVVHVHSPLVAGTARLVIRTLPKHQRPAMVSTEHNSWDSYSFPTRWLNASLHHTDKRRWAVSNKVRASMWRVSRTNVEVLVHGIVLNDVSKVPDVRSVRAELGAAPEDVVAVTVANFRPEKAYQDLLAAAEIALKVEPRLRLIILGQGPLEMNIRKLHSELGLGDRCRIVGYRDDVMRVLAASDFFVLASHFEGFPIALMEAMASGLPVVATDVGGIPDAVTAGTEGILVKPGRPHTLAEAMLKMAMDDQLRLQMARAALTRGRKFDARLAVAETEAAYVDLASITNKQS